MIELLVVIAIIAILAALLTPVAQDALEQGRSAVCKSNLHQLAVALHGFMADHGEKTPRYVDPKFGSSQRGWVGPDRVQYRVYRRHWHYTAWFKSGHYQGGPRDGDGLLGDYLGAQSGSKISIMGCPSAFDRSGVSTWAGAAYPSFFFHYESLALNLDATGLRQGTAGRYVPELEKLQDYVVYADGLGMEGAYINGSRPSEDYTRHAPINRHSGRFNAMFLDSHVEMGAVETHYDDSMNYGKYFVRR